MIIDPVDPFDDLAFAEWFVPMHAAEMRLWPEEPGWSEHELRAIYRNQTDHEFRLAVARDDEGQVVGSIDVSTPVRDNLHVAYIWMAVHPEHEGRGAGRALLEHGELVARRAGRTTLIGDTDEPVGEGESRGHRFAKAAGYKAGRVEARRLLHISSATPRLGELEHLNIPHAAGYEIITWVGSVAEELVDDRAELSAAISADSPRGELDSEPEIWDAERVRRWEKTVVDMDRDLLAAGAVDLASDRLVGFSEIALPHGDHSTAYQLDTVVLRSHRGRRLGMLLKIANLRQLVSRSPTTGRVLTWNAFDNKPMIAVNEALGFELAGIGTSWQKKIPPLDA